MFRVDVYVDLWTCALIERSWRIPAEYCERGWGGKSENRVEECEVCPDGGASESVDDCYRLTTTVQGRGNGVCFSDESRRITDYVAEACTPAKRQSIRHLTVR